MKIFEYLHDIIFVYEDDKSPTFEEQLNEKGSHGWELIQIIKSTSEEYDTGAPLRWNEPVYGTMFSHSCVFKREKVTYEIDV